jgi:DNA-binding response OmpR family regulator
MPVTVLYFEDDASNIALVRTLLALRGVAVHVAVEPTEGFAIAGEVSPSLVLLDLHLGTGSGLQILQALRANAATATTPIVIVTGDPSIDVMDLRRRGADAVVTKPYDISEFGLIVDRLLGTSDEAVAPDQPAAPRADQ